MPIIFSYYSLYLENFFTKMQIICMDSIFCKFFLELVFNELSIYSPLQNVRIYSPFELHVLMNFCVILCVMLQNLLVG